VKVRSQQKVISCEDQEDDQEDEDARELEDVFFEGDGDIVHDGRYLRFRFDKRVLVGRG